MTPAIGVLLSLALTLAAGACQAGDRRPTPDGVGAVDGGDPAANEPARHLCGTRDSPDTRAAALAAMGMTELGGRSPEEAIANWIAGDIERNATSAAGPNPGLCPTGTCEIRVAFHVVAPTQAVLASFEDQDFDQMVAQLNTALGPDFHFSRAPTHRLESTPLSSIDITSQEGEARELALKRYFVNKEGAKGERAGPRMLRVYVTGLAGGFLGTNGIHPSKFHEDCTGYLGQLPDVAVRCEELDGVMLDYITVPGTPYSDDTWTEALVHETGHWLGLFHTFIQGASDVAACDNQTLPDDFIADTPRHLMQQNQVGTCPLAEPDTCPQHPGKDPTSNFMSYYSSDCWNLFSDGQRAWMRQHWNDRIYQVFLPIVLMGCENASVFQCVAPCQWFDCASGTDRCGDWSDAKCDVCPGDPQCQPACNPPPGVCGGCIGGPNWPFVCEGGCGSNGETCCISEGYPCTECDECSTGVCGCTIQSPSQTRCIADPSQAIYCAGQGP